MRQIRCLPEGAASPANSHSRPVVPMSGHHRSANRASGRFCRFVSNSRYRDQPNETAARGGGEKNFS